MAYTFDVNKTPCNGAVAFYRLKELLKSVGWTVVRSSDGTTYNAAGDQITHAGTGAGGMRNLRAWYVIQQPGTQPRQFCIQRSSDTVTTTNNNWRIKYSGGPATGFVGGTPSATQVPSATDEQLIMGGGTDAAPTFTTFMSADSLANRVHILAGGSDENYNFFLFGGNAAGIAPGSEYTVRYAFGIDTLATYSAGDPDPAVVICDWSQNSNTMGVTFATSSSTTGGVFGWIRKGLSGAGFGRMVSLHPCLSTSRINGFLSPNGLTLEDDIFPVLYARPTNASLGAPTGFKGSSRLFRWCGPARAFGTPLRYSTTRDRVAVGWVVIPWDGSLLEF